MRIRHLVLVLAALVLLGSCITYSDPDRMRIADFTDYLSWHKVNDQPLTGPANGLLQGRHLEEGGLREIYANDVARPVFQGAGSLPFPEGSIILKDTFHTKRNGDRGRRWNITVMRKREAGYDAEHNDWEYVTSGPTKFIRVQGRSDLCIECHIWAEDTDYVFSMAE